MPVENTRETVEFIITCFVALSCGIVCIIAIIRVLIGGNNKNVNDTFIDSDKSGETDESYYLYE